MELTFLRLFRAFLNSPKSGWKSKFISVLLNHENFKWKENIMRWRCSNYCFLGFVCALTLGSANDKFDWAKDKNI